MKTNLLILFSFLFSTIVSAQTIIKGQLKDEDNKGIVGANIYLLNSYDGANTDSLGGFQFTSTKTGNQTLVASFIGYATLQQVIQLDGKKMNLVLKLVPNATQISTVTITAGSFEASDTKKGTVLKPLDIVTTSFGQGDIYGAINTLPGTSKVGEKGELFVRGGESYETRTFIDGLMVQKPYSSSMPDLPSRGRFSPFLFKGTVFSTGGYSAEYGQALSSALILQTDGMPSEDVTGVSIMAVGLGISKTKKWDKASISADFGYTDLSPYFSLVKQNTDWIDMPKAVSGSIISRLKTSNTGLLKLYATYSKSNSKLKYPNFDNPGAMQTIGLGSENLFLNMSHKEVLSNNLVLNSSIGLSDDLDVIDIDRDQVKTRISSFAAKYTLNYTAKNWLNIKLGNEIQARKYDFNYTKPDSSIERPSKFNDNNYSMFIENEISLGARFAARVGARAEYASVIESYNLAPRLSMAYKTGAYAQVSFGYGQFFQTPKDELVRFNKTLNFEHANHYIFNYQWMRSNRIFRVEAYRKDYVNLVKYDARDEYNGAKYNNKGHGYAQGLDVFYRDQTTFKNTDLWVSYSYIDTKRNYKDFPNEVEKVPSFVSTNNFSFVYKYWIEKLSTQFSMTYVFADGRTYVNPNHKDDNLYLSDKTNNYNDLSIAFSYLTTIHKHFTVLYVSASNIFGFKNVFGYNYSRKPDPQTGEFKQYSIEPAASRFLFAGLFISIK